MDNAVKVVNLYKKNLYLNKVEDENTGEDEKQQTVLLIVHHALHRAGLCLALQTQTHAKVIHMSCLQEALMLATYIDIEVDVVVIDMDSLFIGEEEWATLMQGSWAQAHIIALTHPACRYASPTPNPALYFSDADISCYLSRFCDSHELSATVNVLLTD